MKEIYPTSLGREIIIELSYYWNLIWFLRIRLNLQCDLLEIVIFDEQRRSVEDVMSLATLKAQHNFISIS